MGRWLVGVVVLVTGSCAQPNVPPSPESSSHPTPGIHVDVPACADAESLLGFTRMTYPPLEYSISVTCGDGSHPTSLLKSTQYIASPAWSPDGTRVLFVMDSDERDPAGGDTGPLNEQLDLYEMNADGTDIVQLTDDPGAEGWPAWSPNSDRYAFVDEIAGNYEIVATYADAFHPANLTRDPALDYSPSWSPDGSAIAFYSTYREHIRDTDPDDPADANLFTMSSDGSNLTQVTSGADEDVDPAWSPDGRWIYFSRAYSQWDLYRIHPDGTGLERLTETPRADEEQVDLAPDDTIALVLSRSGDSRIAVFADEGIVPITGGPSDRSVTFVPTAA
jgi:Tol biopolymer transport system component